MLTIGISRLSLGSDLEEEATWGLEEHVTLYGGDTFVLRAGE